MTKVAEVTSSSLFIKLLEKQNPKSADHVGRLPIVQLADELSLLPDEDPIKMRFTKIVIQSISQIYRLRNAAMEPLSLFFYLSNINNVEIKNSLLSLLSMPQMRRQIYKRAEILRLLAFLGDHNIPGFLRSEKEIYELFPWHWIDAAISVCWDDAAKLITHRLYQEGTADNLIPRLATFWREKGESLISMMEQWKNILPITEQNRIDQWTDRRGIKLPIKPKEKRTKPPNEITTHIDAPMVSYQLPAHESSIIPNRKITEFFRKISWYEPVDSGAGP